MGCQAADYPAFLKSVFRLTKASWLAGGDGGATLVLYEAESEATITGGAYLERLNHPTPWSRKMMPHTATWSAVYAGWKRASVRRSGRRC